MTYSDIHLTEKIDIIKTTIAKAELIIIGAGSGLSAATGLSYDDPDTFAAMFPGYNEHYGLHTINETSFFHFPTPEEYYAFWANFISKVRYKYPAGNPYLDLYRIVKNKNYFTLTINTDGQFLKAGFAPRKICTPQGDCAFFQCSRPCNNKIYHNGQMIEKILSYIDTNDFAIQTKDIPYCPDCGSPLIPNIRNIGNFVGEPWIGKYHEINTLIKSHRGENILLLELGVGYNTPGIIRFPFELLTLHRKNTELVRINLNADRISLIGEAENAAIIQADVGTILHKLAKGIKLLR
jgi:NAD-dependent SIR2 family protein deacetylase